MFGGITKTKRGEVLRRSGKLSYTRVRELLRQACRKAGLKAELYSPHSLRAGGATAAANNGVPDRAFKRHGRWKTDSAKDGYVKDTMEYRLAVSQSLGCEWCLVLWAWLFSFGFLPPGFLPSGVGLPSGFFPGMEWPPLCLNLLSLGYLFFVCWPSRPGPACNRRYGWFNVLWLYMRCSPPASIMILFYTLTVILACKIFLNFILISGWCRLYSVSNVNNFRSLVGLTAQQVATPPSIVRGEYGLGREVNTAACFGYKMRRAFILFSCS